VTLAESAWEKQCGLKRAFGSAKEAERMMRRRGITDQVAYRCEFCRQFHIGHPPSA
jgi:hypothetical protein